MTQPGFHDLISDAQLRKAIDALGYEAPTPVQLAAIPAASQGKNLIVSSKTGSGKTAAFLLPAIQAMLARPSVNPASRTVWFAAWMVGPSIIGSLKGSPTSTTSAPASAAASKQAREVAGSGNPAVR